MDVAPARPVAGQRPQPSSRARGRSRTATDALRAECPARHVRESRPVILIALASTGHGTSVRLPVQIGQLPHVSCWLRVAPLFLLLALPFADLIPAPAFEEAVLVPEAE